MIVVIWGTGVLTPADCDFDKGLCGWTFQREEYNTSLWIPNDDDGKNYVEINDTCNTKLSDLFHKQQIVKHIVSSVR